jgi:hypothetical protein
MLRTIRTTLDRHEMRRDRRYPLPPVTVSFVDGDYTTVNWSLGGFLLLGGPAVEIGVKLRATLSTLRRQESFAVTVEAVRHDGAASGVAFRFVEPSAQMVAVLDHLIADRLVGRRLPARRTAATLRSLALAAAFSGAAFPALADDAAPTGPGPALVRGGAPLPEFQVIFPNPSSALDLHSTNQDKLEIAVTESDQSVLRFLFSPREQFGFSVDRNSGSSRGLAGLTWNVFEVDGLFGNIGLAGTYTSASPEDLNRRLLGPPLAVHQTLEFGYKLNDQHSLSLSLDHATGVDPSGDRGVLGEDLRLGYRYRF